MGVHLKGSHIDVLCVTPRVVERRDFFTMFHQILDEQTGVTDLRVIRINARWIFPHFIRFLFDASYRQLRMLTSRSSDSSLTVSRLVQRRVQHKIMPLVHYETKICRRSHTSICNLLLNFKSQSRNLSHRSNCVHKIDITNSFHFCHQLFSYTSSQIYKTTHWMWTAGFSISAGTLTVKVKKVENLGFFVLFIPARWP